MIAIIDYGLGNLYSLSRSLTYLGLDNAITRAPKEIEAAERLILPGVGAFEDAMKKLRELNLAELIVERAEAGAPLLGICLGMQLLFEESFEYGRWQGLGLIPGDICPIEADLPYPLKVPQIGWNALKLHRACPLTAGVKDGDCVYYVHSYYAKHCEESVVATSEYGVAVPGVVRRGNVYGAQFHPEKSGEVGLKILRNFAEV